MPTMQRKTGESGFTLVIALMLFLAGATAALATISGGVLREMKTVDTESLSKQGYFTAESGLEDAVYRRAFGKQSVASNTLSLASSTAIVLNTTPTNDSLGIRSGAVAGRVTRNIQAILLNVGSSTSSSTIESWKEVK